MLILQSELAGALVVLVGAAWHVSAIWWVRENGQSNHPMASTGFPGQQGSFFGGTKKSLQMAKLKKKLQPN